MYPAILLCYSIFVAYLSLRPMGTGSLEHWDKLGHLGIYALFAILAKLTVQNPRYFVATCVAIFVYSGLLELVQSTMPGRVMSAYDLLANGLGIILGALLANTLLKRLRAPTSKGQY